MNTDCKVECDDDFNNFESDPPLSQTSTVALNENLDPGKLDNEELIETLNRENREVLIMRTKLCIEEKKNLHKKLEFYKNENKKYDSMQRSNIKTEDLSYQMDMMSSYFNPSSNSNFSRKDKIKQLQAEANKIEQKYSKDKKCINKSFYNYVKYKREECENNNTKMKYHELRKQCGEEWKKMTKLEKDRFVESLKNKNSSDNQRSNMDSDINCLVSFNSQNQNQNQLINLIDD